MNSVAGNRLFKPGWLLMVVALGSLGVDSCEGTPTVDPSTCLSCHNGSTAVDKQEFFESPHAELSCVQCHGNGFAHVRYGMPSGNFIDNPADGPPGAVSELCQSCHEAQVLGYLEMAHSTDFTVRCIECHDVHKKGGFRFEGADPSDDELYEGLCSQCHEENVVGFFQGRHAEIGVATCSTCHNVHAELGMQFNTEGPHETPRDLYFDICGNCHGSEIDDYLLSGHSTIEGAATCQNCHNVHSADSLAENPLDNTICLQCHGQPDRGLDTVEAVNTHTGGFHSVDPEGSGASRCVGCHMPPVAQFRGIRVRRDHTLRTVAPIETNNAVAAGAAVPPPNSCAGVPGCHDPEVAGSGSPRDLNDPIFLDFNGEFLQLLYESIGTVP